jgi:hypothetical protein
MSQTRVELLRQDTNFGDIDVDSINNQNYPTAGPLSNRNLIINGAMQVAQRATSVYWPNTSRRATLRVDRMACTI